MKKISTFFLKPLKLKSLFIFLSLTIITSVYGEHDPELYKQIYRENAVQNLNRAAAPILAYEGLDINEGYLDSLLNGAVNDETGDFKLVQLLRILYFTDEYDNKILPVLEDINYWLTKGEDQYCYWSENHMIMWISTAYLLRQLKGWTMDDTMDQRLRHYLKLKLEYGFYEFFSSTYLPYTLSGLLNLADFAEDEEIRGDAEAAANKLMRLMLLKVNDKGAYFPSAGRNYVGKYTNTYGHGHSSIIFILTGMGDPGNQASHIGGFLSTTGIDLSDVAATRQESLDTTYSFGHHQSQKLEVHAGQTRLDRTVFQWSAGGYFHPDTADDTTYTVDYYDLEDHSHFNIFSSIPDFPDNWSKNFARIGATFGRSADISHATIKIFKDKGVVLTSAQNFYPGYFGWQQWPWAATVDDIAVWTQSGEVKSNWNDRNNTANTHLPFIKQVENVALIVYKPNTEIIIADVLNQIDTNVAVYWPADKFDDSFEWNRWIIGRKGNSYIAVFRDKTGKKNGHYYSDADFGRQMWAVVVGNSSIHGSYNNFIDVIQNYRHREKYKWSWKKWKMVYETKIEVDGKSISKKWY